MPHTPTPIRPELRFKIVEPPELVKIQVARLQDANRDVGICLSIKHEIVPCVAIHVNGEGKDDEDDQRCHKDASFAKNSPFC